MEQIESILNDILNDEKLVKIIFSAARKKSLPYKKVTVRPLFLRGLTGYQAEYHYDCHVTHENIHKERLIDLSIEWIYNSFKQVNILTTESDIQILASNPSSPKTTKKYASREAASLDHDQIKKYIIPNHAPCDFLIRLGVMDEKGNVFQKSWSKFRQINRFLEIIQDVSSAFPEDKPLKIIDFGCGKAYLTFAIYHYFKIILNKNVEIIGLDLKEDVIEFCNNAARDLNYSNLHFAVGDIANFKHESADMVVALHACDTATDFALINAVRRNSRVILSVPCCQHELFGQVKSKLDDAYLKHGILKDKFTEILTNGLRGLKLESCGYDVSMIEFTSLEHTSKNVMIQAVRKKGNIGKMKSAEKQYQELKAYWNVDPAIDNLAGVKL